jgi:hypothetical protein
VEYRQHQRAQHARGHAQPAGRDQKIEEHKQYIRNLGKAGIGYTTYAHMGNGIWTSGRSPVRNILDHSPAMVGGNYTQTAYGFAYMKALLNRANAEA